jgi:hypothetical protein
VTTQEVPEEEGDGASLFGVAIEPNVGKKLNADPRERVIGFHDGKEGEGDGVALCEVGVKPSTRIQG